MVASIIPALAWVFVGNILETPKLIVFYDKDFVPVYKKENLLEAAACFPPLACM